MGEKVGTGAVIFVIIALVVALGFIVVRNAGTIPNFFERPGNHSDADTKNAVIQILAPEGGESLQQGTAYTIRWKGGGPMVTLSMEERRSFFGKEGNTVWKASNIRNAGSYPVSIPFSLTGSYIIRVTDGTNTALSKPFEVKQQVLASGWTMYRDANGLFEIQYPSKMNTNPVQAADTYPQKQYKKTVPDFLRAVSLVPSGAKVQYPIIQIHTYGNTNQGLDAWVQSHKDIQVGYARKARKVFGGREWYVFSQVPDIVTYSRGRATTRKRTDMPQEMYVTVAGRNAFVLLVDFGRTGTYTIQPESIIQTFKAY